MGLGGSTRDDGLLDVRFHQYHLSDVVREGKMHRIRKQRDLIPAIFLIVGMVAVAFLGVFDPTEIPAPRCVFKAVTGWDCPGCGTQRAVHALLHGRVAEAWHYNAMLFVAVPLCIGISAGRGPIWRASRHPVAGIVSGVAFVLWWVVRNLMCPLP